MANSIDLAIRITADGKSAVVDLGKVAVAADRLKAGLEASGRTKPLSQQGVDAAAQALERANAGISRAAGSAMILERAQAKLNAQMDVGKISQAQHAAAMRELNNVYNQTGKSAGAATEGYNRIGGSIQRIAHYAVGLAALGQVAQYAKQALHMAEAYGQLQARLKLVSATTGEYAAAQDAVLRIASAIGAPLAETAQLYARMAPVLKEVGFRQNQVADLSELVAKSLRLSGADAQESASTMMQFSQAMGSGVLRGDEFNSLMENSPVLMRKLAEGMNVPIGQLRKMAEEGALTSAQVAESLLKMKGDIDREYGQLPKTVSQAWTSLTNEVQISLGEMDQASGATRALAGGLELVRANLDSVGKAAAVVAGGLALAGTAAALFNPLGLAIAGLVLTTAALAAGFAMLKDAEDEHSVSARKARLEDEKSEKVFNDINASIVRLSKQKAPVAVIAGMTRLRQELRAGKIDSKAAEQALAEMVQKVEVEGGKLRAAESFFRPFMPDVVKIKRALAEVDANYKIMQKNGAASEAAYQAARNQIIRDAYKDQIKVEEDLRKDAASRALTAGQQQIAALLDTEKLRVAAAQGNEKLIYAAREATTQGVKALMRDEYLATKKSAEDRYKEIKDNLDKAIAEEKKYADIVQILQDTLSGKKQEWADADRERARAAMSDASAQVDRINEIDDKLAQAETARAAGDVKSAEALANQSIQLAGNIKNTNDRADAEKRAREIIEKSYAAQIDRNTELMRAAGERATRFAEAERAQKQELDTVSDRLSALDSALKNPRTLDIDNGPALNKIAEVRDRLAELNLNAVTASPSTGTVVTPSALGNVFNRGLQRFAAGGAFSNRIVSRPTVFDMGLMGEAGPEAIMPLARDKSGNLGVRASGGSAGNSIVIQNVNLPGISNARQFVDELRQMLRTAPNLLTVGSRAG